MQAFGMLIYFLAGLASYGWCMSVIFDEFGFIGGVVATFIFPITLGVVPWYVGITQGDWLLLALTYGGGIIASIFYNLGEQA